MIAKPPRTCDEPGCSRPFYGRGRCRTHYMQWFRANRGNIPPRPGRAACKVFACERPNDAHGYCRLHARRLKTSGRLDLPSQAERFMAKVEKTDGCWIWHGAISGGTGYGSCTTGDGRQTGAHRFSYELHIGPIPDGLTIDHLCRNRRCVNPGHLEAVTHIENVRRAGLIGHDHPNAPTTCRRGHDWTAYPPILAHRSDGSVSRRCRICQNDADARRRRAS